MTFEDLIVVPTKCAECPLWHESGYGAWCGHPKAAMHTEADPFAVQRSDGTWRAPDWNDEGQMPERCPLKHTILILKTGATT